MVEIDRLQDYMRHTARTNYQCVSVSPFSLFFHPRDSLTFFNYAIPDQSSQDNLDGPLDVLRVEFGSRDRTPRFEFLEAYAPDLAAILLAHGYREESRLHLMVCSRAAFRTAPTVAGLSIERLGIDTAVEDVQEFLTVQHRGFDPAALPSSIEDARGYRTEYEKSGGAFLARLDGEPAGAGNFSPPFDGLTEIGGIATREGFRRRGIGTAVTAQAVAVAFEHGAQIAFLTAADQRAGRVYEVVGFQSFTTMLAYVDDAHK